MKNLGLFLGGRYILFFLWKNTQLFPKGIFDCIFRHLSSHRPRIWTEVLRVPLEAFATTTTTWAGDTRETFSMDPIGSMGLVYWSLHEWLICMVFMYVNIAVPWILWGWIIQGFSKDRKIPIDSIEQVCGSKQSFVLQFSTWMVLQFNKESSL